MCWYFVKLNETTNTVVYSYSYNSNVTTGQFEYDKVSEKVVNIKYAINHSPNSLSFLSAVYKLIKDYGTLDKKLIAFG